MSETSYKPRKRKKLSYLPVIISITMVLFMLGLLGSLLLQTKNIIQSMKENMVIQLFLTDDVSQTQTNELIRTIQSMQVAKSIVYISKEQAAQEFAAELGQDFVSFLGYNPLMSSIQVALLAENTDDDKLNDIISNFKKMNGVAEVHFQKNIYEKLNNNLKNISMVLFFLALVFAIISVVLINNTIRLDLFAKRFTIKSMQLVGATNWFIIKPFITKSIINAIIGSFLAIVLLILVLNTAQNYISDIGNYFKIDEFAILFAFLIIIGLIISTLSSWLCTLKYLNTKIEDLY